MPESTQQEVLDVIGEEWVITYDQSSQNLMGLCNNHQVLPAIISKIRSSDGKNIVIKDQTIFFAEEE